MNRLDNTQYGIFIMRVALGLVLLAHGAYLKIVVFTLPGTADYFASLGLPGILAYVVAFGETAGGAALVLGFRTRLVAALSLPILLGSLWVHAGNGWLFTNTGGGWEYPLLLSAMAVAQVFLGNGAFAVDSVLEGRFGQPLQARHA